MIRKKKIKVDEIKKEDEEVIVPIEKHFFVKKKLVVEDEEDESENLILEEDDTKEDDKEIQDEEGNKIEFEGIERNTDKNLVEIYENNDGTMPDMKNFKKSHRSKTLKAFFVLLFACLTLAFVAWAGFFVIKPQSQFSEEDVILAISGEEKTSVGQNVKYRIRYRNVQNVSLSKAELEIKYPNGFVFVQSNPSPSGEQKDKWDLGKINAQAGGYIDIEGKMFGDVGGKQSFRVFLNYKPANFSSDFQKVESLTVEMLESPIELSIEMPEKVMVGKDIDIILKIKPKSTTVNNLKIIVEPEVDFNKKTSEPASEPYNQYEWKLSVLDKETEIKFTGSFNTADPNKENSKLIFKVITYPDGKENEEGFVLVNQEKTVYYIKNFIVAQLAVNGSAGDFIATPGDVLNTSLSIKNFSEDSFEDLKVKLSFITPSYQKKSLLDWAKIVDDSDGNITGEQIDEQTRRGDIVWDKRKIKKLAKIESNSEPLTIDVALPIRDMEIMDITQFKTSEIKILAEVVLGGEENSGQVISTNEIIVTVNSDLKMEVEDSVLQINNKEEHTISWILTNNFHELKDIRLEADLYGDFVWKEDLLNVPAGKVEFDNETKKLVWTIDSMPLTVDTLALQFGLLLNSKNPTQTNLTSKVKIKATDVITGKDIIKVGDEILLNN